MRAAPTAFQEVLLALSLPLSFRGAAEAKASLHRLGDSGLWSGRCSDVGCPNNGIETCFILFSQMKQDEMIPMIAFGTPIKAMIPWREHRISNWCRVIQSSIETGPVRQGSSGQTYGDESEGEILFVLCSGHSVTDGNDSDPSLCKLVHRGGIYIFSDNQRVLRTLEASRRRAQGF
jgi:hypothetical protein